MKVVLSCLLFLLSNLLFAYEGEYRIGLYNDTTLDLNKTTHIIIVGSAVKEDSDQFFQSGLSRAIRIKENFPQDQVVIMSSPEVVDRDDATVFSDFHINVVKTVNEVFTQERMISELNLFNKIKSINFFGHSSPWGLKLGKKDAAFDPTSVAERLKKLRPKFLPDAFATLNSCNSGFIIAPSLSEYLAIPVAGTLTSGLFERIESDGKWYKEDDYNRENYVENNQFSFTTDLPCSLTGACVRMKPSRYNYSSYWGNFKEGGLSFSKFFCNFENTNNKCERAMALSLLTFPSVKAINLNSTKEEFKTVLFDWLCQTSKNKSSFSLCTKGIEEAVNRGDLVFKSHTSSELQCDFKSCHAKVVCKDKVFGSGPRKGSCHLETTATDSPTNAANEYVSFLKGFTELKSGN
jgi:hypothetical protein